LRALKIAVSYRRADSQAITGRLHDRLVAHYGDESVFMDIDSIPLGVNFRTHIKAQLAETHVMLLMIGKGWVGARAGATARIFDSDDPCRQEVELAFAQQLLVVPVLVDGASMPKRSELPESLTELPSLNAAQLTSGVNFHSQVDHLIRSLDRKMAREDGLMRPQTGWNPSLFQRFRFRETHNSNLRRDNKHSLAEYLALYFLLPVFCLLVSDYIILFKLDYSPTYLRIAAMLISMLSGMSLYWREGRGIGTAIIMGLVTASAALVGMLAMTAGLRPRAVEFELSALVPANIHEWQELVEYFTIISTGTIIGNLVAWALNILVGPPK
jgi:hypothetical protein